LQITTVLSVSYDYKTKDVVLFFGVKSVNFYPPRMFKFHKAIEHVPNFILW
jgi:hypothetical protein